VFFPSSFVVRPAEPTADYGGSLVVIPAIYALVYCGEMHRARRGLMSIKAVTQLQEL
jgi:hypothetical protein